MNTVHLNTHSDQLRLGGECVRAERAFRGFPGVRELRDLPRHSGILHNPTQTLVYRADARNPLKVNLKIRQFMKNI